MDTRDWGRSNADVRDRAVAWFERLAAAENEGHGLLPAGHAAQLATWARAGGTLAPDCFASLVQAAQLAWRVARDDPTPFNVAQALSLVKASTTREPWPVQPHIDPRAFAAYAFARTGEGIDDLQRRHQAGWQAHAEHARRFILEAVQSGPARGNLVVIGAAHAHDLPLVELAQRSAHLTLVDVEGAALAAQVQQLAPRPGVVARVSGITADVTGIGNRFFFMSERIVRTSRKLTVATRELCAALEGYRCTLRPPWSNTDEPHMVVSTLVVSQLAQPLVRWMREQVEHRFGPGASEDARLEAAIFRFSLRVQQDHIDMLCAAAADVVLISDVWEQTTSAGPDGRVATSDERLLMGAFQLTERLLQPRDVVRLEEWLWERVAPTRDADGSLVKVQAAHIRREG